MYKILFGIDPVWIRAINEILVRSHTQIELYQIKRVFIIHCVREISFLFPSNVNFFKFYPCLFAVTIQYVPSTVGFIPSHLQWVYSFFCQLSCNLCAINSIGHIHTKRPINNNKLHFGECEEKRTNEIDSAINIYWAAWFNIFFRRCVDKCDELSEISQFSYRRNIVNDSGDKEVQRES